MMQKRLYEDSGNNVYELTIYASCRAQYTVIGFGYHCLFAISVEFHHCTSFRLCWVHAENVDVTNK